MADTLATIARIQPHLSRRSKSVPFRHWDEQTNRNKNINATSATTGFPRLNLEVVRDFPLVAIVGLHQRRQNTERCSPVWRRAHKLMSVPNEL